MAEALAESRARRLDESRALRVDAQEDEALLAVYGTCLLCGGQLRHEAGSAARAREMKAAVRCVGCRKLSLVTVRMETADEAGVRDPHSPECDCGTWPCTTRGTA